MVPPHIRPVYLLWLPGHCGLHLNKMPHSLARAYLNSPVSVLPTSTCVTSARCRNFSISPNSAQSTLTPSPEFHHLSFPWNNKWCPSRQFEIFFATPCRIPSLKFALNFALRFAGMAWLLLLQRTWVYQIFFFLLCRQYLSQLSATWAIPVFTSHSLAWAPSLASSRRDGFLAI